MLPVAGCLLLVAVCWFSFSANCPLLLPTSLKVTVPLPASLAIFCKSCICNSLIFFINGLVFILIGLQLSGVLERLGRPDLLAGIGVAVLVSLTTILVRFVWVFPTTYLPRLLIPGYARRDPSPPISHVTVLA